jgi:uncharacterized protein YdaU (DUF1376 family)
LSNRAWMPLHIDDYIRDTDHLSATEHGAYLLLIMKYWREGGLPSDEALIRRYAKLSTEQWAESRDVLAALFDGGWRHKRIDAELAKAADIIEKRKSAGKRTQFHGKTSANAEQMPEHEPSKSTAPLTSNLSDANASGEASPADPREAVWSEGVSSLKAITGKTDSAARSMIGKWLKDAKDDCTLVLGKIRTAKAERIGDPIPWITAALKPPDKPPKARNAGQLSRMQLEAMRQADAPGTENGHHNQGDANQYLAGPGLARRFAIPTGG